MYTRRELLAASCQASAVAWAAGAATAATANQPTPLRIAQIGMQGHYAEILPHIPKLPNCQLVAVARSAPDEPVEQLKKSPAWNNEVRIFDDYRRMLDEVKPDIVATFMPCALNVQANTEALRRGCHIISEKPLACTLPELEAFRQEFDRHPVKLTTLLVTRLEPAMAAARKVVADGLIGEPLVISAQKSYKWGRNRPEFYKDRKIYGGSIAWIGIHAIDFIRYVSGVPFADVTARHAVKVHTDYPGCEDCGALLFELRNGGQAVLTFDYLRSGKAPSHGDDRLRIAGSKGVVEVRLAGEATCDVTTLTEPPQRLALPKTGETLFGQFVAFVRGGPAPVVTADDAFLSSELALKAREAADTRQTVKL